MSPDDIAAMQAEYDKLCEKTELCDERSDKAVRGFFQKHASFAERIGKRKRKR